MDGRGSGFGQKRQTYNRAVTEGTEKEEAKEETYHNYNSHCTAGCGADCYYSYVRVKVKDPAGIQR